MAEACGRRGRTADCRNGTGVYCFGGGKRRKVGQDAAAACAIWLQRYCVRRWVQTVERAQSRATPDALGLMVPLMPAFRHLLPRGDSVAIRIQADVIQPSRKRRE